MQIKSLLLLLNFVLFVAGLHAQANLEAEFDKILENRFKPDQPGAAVLVAKNGKVIYLKAGGMADLERNVPLRPDHVFRIGSVTKQFTAVAILRLAEQGKLSLQDEITRFIPDYPTHGKKITVEQLLNHTSGIKSYTNMSAWTAEVQRKDFTPAGMVDFFKNEPMDFDPGTQWNYSNSGYFLLGYIIEKVSGQSYATYIEEQFFKPLGMKNSYYDMPEDIIKNRAAGYQPGAGGMQNAPYLSMTQPYAAGSLASTVEDLFIWTHALHSGNLLSAESLQKATTPCILPNGENTHYGFGLQTGNLLGSPTIEHGGGIHGFLSHLMYLPKEDVCVAILTNCNCSGPQLEAAKLAAIAAGIPLEPATIPLDAAALEAYTGIYEDSKGEERVISVDGGVLYSQRSGGTRFKLTPYAPDRFYFESLLARAWFKRNAAGEVTVVSIGDRDDADNPWEKTDKKATARKEIKVDAAVLEKYIGEYELAPGFNLKVMKEGDQMRAQATGQGAFDIFAESETMFFLKVVDARIEFFPDENGMVNKLVLHQAGQQIEGTRLK
ncbi:MAG: serine hydrolase [Lewinellaceae bacterium]|nr:serine hydrolase [Lewinellaceae bacterium]